MWTSLGVLVACKATEHQPPSAQHAQEVEHERAPAEPPLAASPSAKGLVLTPLVVLSAPQPEAWLLFGDTLEISGTTLLVGARGKDCEPAVPESSCGGTYLYEVAGTEPRMKELLVPTHSDRMGSYGVEQAIVGDRVIVSDMRERCDRGRQLWAPCMSTVQANETSHLCSS